MPFKMFRKTERNIKIVKEESQTEIVYFGFTYPFEIYSNVPLQTIKPLKIKSIMPDYIHLNL